MEKKIINFVKNNLYSASCVVKKGYTLGTYRVVFQGMISGLFLNFLIAFCELNNFSYYITTSFDGSNQVEFIIYK